MKSNRPRKYGFLLMGIGLMLVAFGVYGLLRPAEYKALTRIKPTRLDIESLETPEHFRQIEIETIQSNTILSNVLLRLDPDSGLGKNPVSPETTERLRRRLEVRSVRNTTLIEICVVDENAAEAARIANGISRFYCEWRRAQWDKYPEASIAALEKELQLTDQKLKQAEAELERLNAEFKIQSPEPTEAELQTNYPAYQKAKNAVDHLNAARKQLVRKISIEKIDLTIPKSAAVEIIELAIPPTAPMRRTKPLGALLIVAGAICFGWGFALVLNSKPPNSEGTI